MDINFTPTKEFLASDTCWEKKNQLSLIMKNHWVYHQYSGEGPMSMNRWLPENVIHSFCANYA